MLWKFKDGYNVNKYTNVLLCNKELNPVKVKGDHRHYSDHIHSIKDITGYVLFTSLLIMAWLHAVHAYKIIQINIFYFEK